MFNFLSILYIHILNYSESICRQILILSLTLIPNSCSFDTNEKGYDICIQKTNGQYKYLYALLKDVSSIQYTQNVS